MWNLYRRTNMVSTARFIAIGAENMGFTVTSQLLFDASPTRLRTIPSYEYVKKITIASRESVTSKRPTNIK
jgi:hypothetical protein